MSVTNLSNYRIGNKYFFYVGELSEANRQQVTVTNKDNHRIELLLADGTKDWYDKTQLTPVEKNFRLVLARKNGNGHNGHNGDNPLVQTVEICQPDKLLIPTANAEKLLDGESVDDYKYIARCMKHDLRLILKKHGFETDKTWTIAEVLGLINNKLPYNK